MSLDPVSQLGQKLGGMARTQEETKDAINPNEEISQRQFSMTDNIIIEQLPLVLRTRDVTEETIWDRGTAYEKWDSPLAKWSDGTHLEEQVVHTVYNDNKTYKEYFKTTLFKDITETTATWGTNGLVFTNDSVYIAQSLSIAYNVGTFTTATLNIEGTFNLSAGYAMSADGGTNWESITPGVKHTFTNTGSDLRFKMSNATTQGAGWPTEWASWGSSEDPVNMTITKMTVKYEVS